MHRDRFDGWTRAVATLLSRRTLAGVLAFGALALPGLTEAKKKHRRKKKKKIKRNQFGCVNVGNFCKHNSQCCSNLCQGKRGKKQCRAHDAQGCEVAHDSCVFGTTNCLTSAGKNGFCHKTIGNAGFCAFDAGCFPCTRDQD